MKAEEFICPECGSREASGTVFVSTDCTLDDPWSGILQRLTCGQCRSVIPAHLGHRWNKLSIEAAQKEWSEVYREAGVKLTPKTSQKSTWRIDIASKKKKRIPPGTYFWIVTGILLLDLAVGFIMAVFDRGDTLERLRGKRVTNSPSAK